MALRKLEFLVSRLKDGLENGSIQIAQKQPDTRLGIELAENLLRTGMGEDEALSQAIKFEAQPSYRLANGLLSFIDTIANSASEIVSDRCLRWPDLLNAAALLSSELARASDERNHIPNLPPLSPLSTITKAMITAAEFGLWPESRGLSFGVATSAIEVANPLLTANYNSLFRIALDNVFMETLALLFSNERNRLEALKIVFQRLTERFRVVKGNWEESRHASASAF